MLTPTDATTRIATISSYHVETIFKASAIAGLEESSEAGYVVSRRMSYHTVHYMITEKGRRALGDVQWRWAAQKNSRLNG
jgi:DNA-binding PadR family transcriptional regulator